MPELELVFVEEQEGGDPPRLLGTFAACLRVSPRRITERAEGLTCVQAIAWGRERSGIVLVRFGRRTGWWSAGATPHWSYPAWPPPDVPALVPRPVPPGNWREDGFEVAAGLEWAVTLWLQPRDLAKDPGWDQQERWRIAVATAASDCRSGWDSECIDGFLADLRHEGTSFFTMWPPAYRIHFVIDAATAREAQETAGAACVAPSGFDHRWTARPADLDDE